MAASGSAIVPDRPLRPSHNRGVSWWSRATALAADIGNSTVPSVHYRLGDAVLEIASDCAVLNGELSDHYGECVIPRSQADRLPRVRCMVHACDDDRLALIRYCEPTADALAIALGLLKHPASAPAYVEHPTSVDGWRLIVHATTGIPVIAARGAEALVDVQQSPIRFLARLVVDLVLAVQRELLFLHAASLGIAGGGVLLIGPSGSGKTTTALTLASRGHAYFGDDVAAIRTATMELQPFWRTAHIRPGPHGSALARHVATGQWDPPYADGLPRLRLRVGELFANAPAPSVPVRLALFLRSLAEAPRAELFVPTRETLSGSSRYALNNTVWVAWGTTPHRRLMQFMLFERMLARMRCAWLDVGKPDATADLIETMMEDVCHSQ
jgi:HPr Serine kinase C-terminal domain